jgi:hypothetical protein
VGWKCASGPGQRARDGFGGVDRAASADADEQISLNLARQVSRFDDSAFRHVLPDIGVSPCMARAQQALDCPDQR